MNIGKAIYGILSSTTAVTDIVGTKIFPEIAEQETAVPFVIYQVQSVQPEDTHDGPSKLDEVRVEVLCYDDAYNGAADLASAVRGALDRVRGTYNGVNVESVQFNDVDFEIEYDPRRYSQVLTFTFRIKRDDIEIALGTPITGAQLGDLSDVEVTGVTDNQILSYDAASDTWVPAADAGGAEVLDDLSDVDASQPEDNQMLAYQQGEWTTIYQDEIVLPILSVTGLQAALDAAPDNLRELTDVTISGLTDGDYLQYDSAAGEWQNSSLILGRNGEQYTGNYDTEAGTLRSGATETVELYYTAQADGDGLSESASSDTPTSGYDIRRKLYYAEKAQADPDTSADWTQFTAIADNTTFNNAKAALLAYLKERTGGTVPISLKMTWEEVSQTAYLLDQSYGSGAEAAYSTRQLRNAATDCMVIRRASDSTTTTIGFVDGDIDEAAIETFCTGTTCTVYQWLDQSGNGNTATAPSTGAEPTIYTGGALVKENGKVALDFNKANTQHFEFTTDGFAGDYVDLFLTGLIDTYSAFGTMLLASTTSANTYWQLGAANNYFVQGAGSATAIAVNNSTRYLFNQFSDAATINVHLSGSDFSDAFAVSAVPSGSRNYLIGKYPSGNNWDYDGRIQEFIAYPSQRTSGNRTSIEENIGDYFTQNTPLLDTYSGAAAAYSLRLLDSTYTGSAVEVYNGSSYADIGFNVFGELDTVALAAHCGSNDGFVSVWYDQSGNSNDATQTTTANMPKIYDGSTGVVTENGKPAVNYGTASDSYFLQLASYTSLSYQSISTITVGSNSKSFNAEGSISFTMLGLNTSPRYYHNIGLSGGLYLSYSALEAIQLSTTSQNSQYLSTVYANNSTASAYFNGTSKGSVASVSGNSARIALGYNGGTSYHNGNIQEVIIYPSDQSSNRTGIEDNINTFYNIY